ncbi:stress responsive A/B barrel domain protein [Microdochium trichocladiopsis]|uniref:Stress responsive A/B barrel domain protein n=1 Tax=Microdochium trichocladiopsis TaxID=1682393 RepID=A0A9P8XTQ4_9PEZI|nr:stress responsive A/B barrel domain protein [Microdochium trichocladiopsis]KAH7018170.1 stress responsive A/B barrel domain protein [Microdochium trichocladiopsis]
MTVYHVVIFKFKTLVPEDEVQAACDRMLALGTQCVHPKSGKPYVKVHGGGRDNSKEGLQQGMTHPFIFEFENEEDRDYYVDDDPAHIKFKDSLTDVVDKVHVHDFSPGKF